MRGKWEAPELLQTAANVWLAWRGPHKNYARCRVMLIEDKTSGTGLIQQLKRGISVDGEMVRVPVTASQSLDSPPFWPARSVRCERPRSFSGAKASDAQSSPWPAPYASEATWQWFGGDRFV